MKLDDFQQPKLSIQDYKLDDSQLGVNISRSTAAQLAANEMIRGEEPTVDQFRQDKEALLTPEGREAYRLKQSADRTSVVRDMEEGLGPILLDPSLSDEEKRGYVDGVRSARENYKPNPIDILVEEATMATSRPNETEQEHESRLNFVDSITEVNNYKRQASARINALEAERNPNLGSMAVDLGELMVPFSEWADTNQMYQDLVGEGDILLGEQREKLFQVMENMPYDKRAEFSEMLIDYVNEHGNVILPDGNDLTSLDTLQRMTVDNDYRNFEKWFDNATSVLDVAGVLGAGAALVRGASKSAKTARKARVANDTKPTSPSQLVKDANPESARAMNTTVSEDATEEAAEALYGTTKTDALAKDHLPEPELTYGEVPNKVVQYGPDYPEPEYLQALRKADGQTYLSEGEVARVQSKVIDDLEDVQGMRVHKESTTIRDNKDGSLGIDMMYRPVDSGFKSADKALQNARFAFKNYGITDDSLTLYRRTGDKWIQTTQKLLKARKDLRDEFTRAKKKIPEELKEIDYAVGVKYDYRFSPEDLEAYDLLNTGKIFGALPANLLDRLPSGPSKWGQGSLTQNFLDAASVLHPQITNPANVAVDRTVALKKAYVDTFENFTKGYKGLSKEARAQMSDYIHKANFEGIPFNEADLYARGFDADEVEMLREWRKANDYMFHAANDDMAKTLRNKGYKIFVHDETETRLFVKPIKRGAAGANTKVYNVVTDSVEHAGSKQQLDEFYEGGGTYAELSEPIQVGDDWISVVKVDETQEGGYLRAIAENERVLNYRPGYYPVMYDANFFVYKTVTNAEGEEFQKVVASAKNSEDATKMVEDVRANNPDIDPKKIDYRPDRRNDQDKSSEFDEMGWSLGVNTGISSQKVRGERLVDAGGDLHKAGMSNLHDPLEAVANQIQQLSQRVAMRNYLDTTKRRWVENYAEELGLEKDRTGNYRFPSSISQVVGKGTTDSQTLADARSLFNYIYSLENGYINHVDETFKAAFNFGADIMSKMKWNKAEESLRDWAGGSFTNAGKAAVFKMYLAANPQRQLVIQAHQAVQLNAINPKYMAGGMQWDLYRLGRVMRGYKGDKEATEMYDELKSSGMLEAVDANNLVRQDMLRLADLTAAQKTGSVLNKPLQWSQKLGFDTAEQFVLVTSWLAHRDKAVKAGKKLSRRTYDEIAGDARSFTYSMNRAGDMPYNRNSLNIIAQFLQVPHKAMLQPLTNRTLTPRQRTQLFAWNTAMYGVPTGLAGAWFYDAFEPGPTRDSIEHGLEHVILNEVATQASRLWNDGQKQKQQIDWSDLAPTDLHGMSEFVFGLWTEPVGAMVSESPAGSLIFGSNPRLTEMMKTTARWANLRDDYDDPELDTKFTDVGIAAANLFSGFSNAFKAKYAYETGTKLSSLGNVNDSDVTKFEAAMQFFGFKTETESGTWKINEELFGDSSFDAGPGGDVDMWYKELKRQITRRGTTVKERDMAQRILTEGMRVFQDDPYKFNNRLTSLIRSDLEENQFNIFERVLQQVGWKNKDDVIKLLEKLPESEDKRVLRQSIQQLGVNDG